MSTQQLAKACEQLGHPIARSVLANFENGRRLTVSVPEIYVLAHALDVSPALLLFPLGREETVETSPGKEVPTWDALKWFAGRTAPGPDNDHRSDVPTVLWEAHDNIVSGWLTAPNFMINQQRAGIVPTEDAYASVRASRRLFEDSLRALRVRMRTLGLTPPPLPDELQRIADQEGEK